MNKVKCPVCGEEKEIYFFDDGSINCRMCKFSWRREKEMDWGIKQFGAIGGMSLTILVALNAAFVRNSFLSNVNPLGGFITLLFFITAFYIVGFTDLITNFESVLDNDRRKGEVKENE